MACVYLVCNIAGLPFLTGIEQHVLIMVAGIIEGAKDGKGRGRQVISTARTCNLILIILDCLKPLTHKKVRPV